MTQRSRWIVLLLVAAVCAACSQHGEQVTAKEGPFTIVREQHTYSNWNTGGTTTYYSVDVRYRKREFSFPGLSYSGNRQTSDTDMASRRIESAYVVSQSPAALLVVAGDLSNDASWYLLVDTPSGLHAEHVAFFDSYGGLAWLDGDVPVPIDDRGELLKIEGGRWLWVNSESILDFEGLKVYRLPSHGGSRGGALFVAFSPDRRKIARYDSTVYSTDSGGWHPVIIENDIASGQVRSFDIDRRTMWFDTSEDIDRVWLESYFEWREDKNGGFSLQPLGNPKPRPYRGRLDVENGTNGLQYHVPRLRYKHRQAAMDFIAAFLERTYAIEKLQLDAQERTAPVAVATSNDVAVRTYAEVPPSISPFASADIDIEGKQLTVYFTENGLGIENHDPALNEVVQKIATKLDAEFQKPRGLMWIAEER